METNKSQDQRKKFQEDLVRQLIESRAPWQIPRPAGFEMPYNAANGEPFHPYNAMKLLVAGEEKGYQDPRWMTYGDAQNAGYQVTERGAVMIEKYERSEWVPETDQKTGEPVLDEERRQKYVQIPLQSPKLVPVYLFNAAQIEGMPPYERLGKPQSPERIENILRASKAAFIGGAEKTHYSPQHDTINLLSPDSYPSREAMHIDALRGLCQWTASYRRLNLTSNDPAGTANHARGQIRVEIFAMIAASEYGVAHIPRPQIVPDSLVRAIKNNPSELRNLSNDASLILNRIRTFDKKYDMSKVKTIRPQQPSRIIPKSLLVFKDQPLVPAEELSAFAKDMGLVINGSPILNGQEQKVIDPSGVVTGNYQGEPGQAVTVENILTGEKAEWLEKGYHLGTSEKADLAAGVNLARIDRAIQEEMRYDQARERCVRVLNSAIALNPDSTILPEFLSERKLKAHGLYMSGEDLLIPARDIHGRAWSYQTISPTGERHFPSDSRTLGCMAVIGGRPEQIAKESVVIIAESYESAAALHEVSKKPVAVAFSAQNMKAVAEELHAQNPSVQITFFTDRSSKIQNEARDKVLGQDTEKYNAKLVKPIGSTRNFNDVLQKFDRDTLKNLVDTSLFRKEVKNHEEARTVSRTKTLDAGIAR